MFSIPMVIIMLSLTGAHQSGGAGTVRKTSVRERKRAAQISDARLKNGAAEERSGDRRKTRTYLRSSCVQNKDRS